MKDILAAVEIGKAFISSDDAPLRDLMRLLKAAHRKTCRLELASLAVSELLHKMRWRTWSKGTMESLGLGCMDEWDEVMMELDRAIDSGRRKSPKKISADSGD